MAIYRTLYYGDVTVGVGGRITIPQDTREDLGIEEGDMVWVGLVVLGWGWGVLVLWCWEVQPDHE